jgi:hypothetical protein
MLTLLSYLTCLLPVHHYSKLIACTEFWAPTSAPEKTTAEGEEGSLENSEQSSADTSLWTKEKLLVRFRNTFLQLRRSKNMCFVSKLGQFYDFIFANESQ